MVVGPDDITLAFVDYFDFSQVPIKEFRYYLCKILKFPWLCELRKQGGAYRGLRCKDLSRRGCRQASSLISDYSPLDFAPAAPESNSSAIQRCSATMLCGRPRKFLTRSLADIEPPGSRTTRR
jgi:hypothetical protein